VRVWRLIVKCPLNRSHHWFALSQTLLQLVIEQLECLGPTANRNYDFLVLQATDNSIPFYESLGFVRVGALIQNEVKVKSDPASPTQPPLSEFVASEVTTYKVAKAGTCLADIAQRQKADVWDIIFLNKDVYKDLAPKSRLLAGTSLFIPSSKPSGGADPLLSPRRTPRLHTEPDQPQYHVAKENETPRHICKMFNVDCNDLIGANRSRLPDLMPNSRLRQGTRVKISHFDVPEENYRAYAHWTFPDDTYEQGEPSYMMALRLNRRRGAAARERPVEQSLAVPITAYEPTDLLLPTSPVRQESPISVSAVPVSTKSSKKASNVSLPPAPQPPKRALSSFMLFSCAMREKKLPELIGLRLSVSTKILSQMWTDLPPQEKQVHECHAEKLKQQYFKEKERYERDLAAYRAKHGLDVVESPVKQESAAAIAPASAEVGAKKADGTDLYNMVVRLKPGAVLEGKEYQYW
jgi:HMG (high mobility group) box